MDKEAYDKIMNPINKSQYGVKILKGINYIITSLVYGIYPILLVILILNKDPRVWKVFLIPGISFVLIGIFRNYVDFPRPYELFDITPIINKASKGKSFPSRHVFSIFVIAIAFYYIYIPIGITLLILGTILAITRVIGGVHFPRDVIVGALVGILTGVLGFLLF